MHAQSSVIAIEEVDGFLSSYREQSSTGITEGPDVNWVIDDGCLQHKEIDFFEIVAVRDPFERRQLMIRQRESALVGLLCTTVDDERYVLVSARCEPGLRKTCQLTTTIQSTPSNYLRRHKGSPTPFIEYFVSRVSGSRTLYDSLQTDWGDYYQGKTKRFHIVEVDNLLPTGGAQRWIRLSDLQELLFQDYVITSDLRVAWLLLYGIQIGANHGSYVPTTQSMTTNLQNQCAAISTLDLQELQLDGSKYYFADDYGRSVVFVRFTSTSREVGEWSQPLLVIDSDKKINLWLDERTTDTRFAVCKGTQFGLRGIDQWFPGRVVDEDHIVSESTIMQVKTSAEGGRFYQHDVNLSLHRWNGEIFDGPVEWWSRTDLLSAVANAMSASIELRMISSLIF